VQSNCSSRDRSLLWKLPTEFETTMDYETRTGIGVWHHMSASEIRFVLTV
jgi:hypothetical protein